MKVLHVNTSDVGGAAKACERLHLGLIFNDVDSKQLSLFNYRESTTFFNFFSEDVHPTTDRLLRSLKYRYYNFEKELLLLNKPRDYEVISLPKTAFDITRHRLYREADIVHLHWAAGFLDYLSFFKNNKKPVIWTLHDLNPFSGIFHYENDLLKNLKYYQFLDEETKYKKFEYLKKANNLTFVSVSDWIRNKFLSSEVANIFPCTKISNGIDLTIFKPRSKSYLREKFSLPVDKKVILFVSENIENERKGFKYLIKALNAVDKSNILLCVLGNSKSIESLDGFDVHHFGFVEDEHILSQIYSLADLFIITSLEDNFPNTILEAASSGLPVAGFRTGGISEMVIQNQTGLLADLKDVGQLIDNINSLIEDENRLMSYSANSRKFAEKNFNLDKMVKQYYQLYYKVW